MTNAHSGRGWIALAIITLLLAAACGGGGGGDVATTPDEQATSPADGGEASAEEVSLKVGRMPFADAALQFVAEQEGIFTSHGLDVETTNFQSGSDAVSAVIAGELDLTYAGVVPQLSAMAAGAGIEFVAGHSNGRPEAPDFHAVVVRSDSGISSVEDLRGKRIAANIVGSVVWLTANKWLEQNGISSDEVEFAEVPFPQMTDALLQGQVDAILALEPFVTITENTGEAEAIAYPYVEVLPGLPGATYVARGEWLAENQDAADRFIASIDEAAQLAQTDEKRYRELVAEYTGMEPELASDIVLGVPTAEIHVDELQQLADFMADLDVIDSAINVEEFVYDGAMRP